MALIQQSAHKYEKSREAVAVSITTPGGTVTKSKGFTSCT